MKQLLIKPIKSLGCVLASLGFYHCVQAAGVNPIDFNWLPSSSALKPAVKLRFIQSGFYDNTSVILCQNHSQVPVIMCCTPKGSHHAQFIYTANNNSCQGGAVSTQCHLNIAASGQYNYRGTIDQVNFNTVQHYCQKPV